MQCERRSAQKEVDKIYGLDTIHRLNKQAAYEQSKPRPEPTKAQRVAESLNEQKRAVSALSNQQDA